MYLCMLNLKMKLKFNFEYKNRWILIKHSC